MDDLVIERNTFFTNFIHNKNIKVNKNFAEIFTNSLSDIFGSVSYKIFSNLVSLHEYVSGTDSKESYSA